MPNCDNITMNGLNRPKPCANNMSGVKTMFACPVDDIVAINAVAAAEPTTLEEFVTIGSSTLSTKAITCKDGKGFVRIYCADNMGELKYIQQGTLTGCRSWKGSLELFHPGFKRGAIGFMAYINNKELVLVALMNNGEYHLLGDKERGAKLADGNEMSSGKTSEDNNGVNPVLEYNTPVPQIFWDGFDPYNETNGLPILGESVNADTL